MLPPEENKEDDSETYSAVAVGRLEPRSDDDTQVKHIRRKIHTAEHFP